MDKNLIHKIVKASGVVPGEVILVQFWGEDKEIHLMHAFAAQIVALGATPIELQQSRTENGIRFMNGSETCYNEKYFQLFKKIDGVIDVFAYQPVVLDIALEEIQKERYRSYMGQLFKTLAETKRFIQVRIPNEANAENVQLETKDFIDRMVLAYDVDYDKIKVEGKEKIKELAQKKQVMIKTGQGCTLSFSLEGRDWHLDAGDGDMPCGEIYIAPIEDKTVGKVYFEKLYTTYWGSFDQITIEIDGGIITNTTNAMLNEQLLKLSTAERCIGELGFGLNKNVKDLCGYAVLDEKAYGTFHIGMGDNQLFGGKNEARFHMDLVGMGELCI